MYEFEIYNAKNDETMTIWGYDEINAFRRHPELDDSEWKIVNCEYID